MEQTQRQRCQEEDEVRLKDMKISFPELNLIPIDIDKEHQIHELASEHFGEEWRDKEDYFWSHLKMTSASATILAGLRTIGVRSRHDQWVFLVAAFFHFYGREAFEWFLCYGSLEDLYPAAPPTCSMMSAVVNFGLERFGFTSTRCDAHRNSCGCRWLRECFHLTEEGEPIWPQKAWPIERQRKREQEESPKKKQKICS